MSKATDKPGYLKTQLEFTAYLRDPDNNPAPEGIPQDRIDVYKELLFNNILGTLDRCFPVLRKFYSDEEWRGLCRQFYAQHVSTTPYFREIPKEFLAFLQHEYEAKENDPQFMIELAHYEWVEAALLSAEDPQLPEDLDPEGDLLSEIPFVSPLAWTLGYHYPVHRISPEFVPDEPGVEPTWIIVYRDRNDNVGFTEINPATARLIQILDERQTSGTEALKKLATEMAHDDVESIIEYGKNLLNDLRERSVVLGSLPENDK